MSYPFTQAGITLYAPNESGVYWIMDLQGSAIYVGESASMQGRLFDHHNGNSDQSPCIWNHVPSLFDFRKLPLMPRLQAERELINRWNPACNR